MYIALASSHDASAAWAIAYKLCWMDRLRCVAKVSTSAPRIRSRAVKSDVPALYFHDAVTEVARMRSSVSGSVVYRSRGKPEKAESIVFNTERFDSPDAISLPCASRVTTAVHCSPPACTNACG